MKYARVGEKIKNLLYISNKKSAKINLQHSKKYSTFAAVFEKDTLIYMSKNLMIVESPTKAEKFRKFLGKDFRVMASKGHIRDIEGAGKNSIGIDFSNNYAPN